MRRRNDPPDRLSMAGSVTVHSVAILLAWWSAQTPPQAMVFESYEIELVSPPPAQVAAEVQPAREELVVERPDPTPPPEPEETPVTEPDPTPPPPTPEPEPETPLPDPEPEVEETQEATTEDPPEEEAR